VKECLRRYPHFRRALKMVGLPCPTPNNLKDCRFERTPNYELVRGAHMSLAYTADHSPFSSAEVADELEKYLCLHMHVMG
jgi:hypothetical protein